MHTMLSISFIIFSFNGAHTIKVMFFIYSKRAGGEEKSLYLILKVLLPPLGSNVGRKMLREFHIAGTSVLVEAPLGVRAAVPSAVDATFVISVNLAAPLNMRRVKPGALRSLLLPPYSTSSSSRPRPVFFFSSQEPLTGSVTLLRPSPGKCADIAVRHRFRASATWLRQQSAQAAGSSGRCSWWWQLDPLRNTSWQCGHRADFNPSWRFLVFVCRGCSK